MLAIKLSRFGKKKAPTYRILVMEKTKDPWGDFLENVGHYNPRCNPKELVLKEDRIKYWIEKGAQPTDSVHNLLVENGLIKDKKRNVSSLGKKVKQEMEETAKKESEAKAAKKAEEQASKEPSAEVNEPTESAGATEAPKEEEKAEEKK